MWDDIDFEKGRISINKSSYKVKGEKISVKQPKTVGSVRLLAIPPFLVDMLTDYKREQALLTAQIGAQWTGDNWLFTQWNGAPMYPSTPTLWFSGFLERNGLPHKKFYALRHTSATLLFSSGTNIKTVVSRLGHTRLSTTNCYVHAMTDADVAAAQAFENMFSEKKSETGKE
jgi:integrase